MSWAVVLPASVLLAAACSSTDHPGATNESSTPTSASASARPTLTAPKLQPPSQDNQYTSGSGRPKVVFDPCTWIPDEPIAKSGYDPSTRKRDDVVAEYTILTCDFKNSDGALQLMSGNVTLAEDKQKYAASQIQNIKINGRDAIQLNKNADANADECDVDMQTKAGFFGVSVIVDTAGEVKGLKPCDHIVDIAKTLEPYIGKDN